MVVVRAGALILLVISGIVAGGSPGSLQGARLPAGVALAPPTTATPMVATGGGHTCALNSNGAVRCWGANHDGQLGDGTTISHQRPALVAGLSSGVTAIAAGFSHTCALTTAGGVKCWGTNADGELGDFTQVERTTPVDVINLTSGVVAISAGDRHTCALLATGGMKCWGYNVYGEVGNGTSGNLWLGAVDVCASGSGIGCAGGAPLTGMASMSAGGINTCAVTTAGALKCWGGNYSGQLGQGFAPDSPLPPGGICPTSAEPNASCVSLPADVPSLQSGIAAVDAGQITCALTTAGGVKCWGYNYWGDVGDGTRTTLPGDAPNYAVSTPVDVTGLASGVDAVSRPCALLASGGVKCWGDNAYGQIGDGTTAIRTTPVDVFGLSSGVASISGGGHACVVMAAGGLKCWGQNGAGQLGAPTTETCAFGAPCSTVPVDVQQCMICVEGLTFEHQVYPDEVNWAPVGAEGTVDGNQVRINATLRNQAGTDQPVTLEFRDVDTGALLPGASIDGTVPASGELPVTYVWNTDGFAWDGGAARSPRHVRVTVLQGSTTADTDIRSIKIVPKPVVLVHGWNSNYGTWASYQGFLTSVSPDWKAFAVGDLQAPGVMNTGSMSHPFTLTNTIDQNAIEMSHYVQGVRQKLNAWHVDVVAHSMGGLISRDYIQYWMPPDAYGRPIIDHLVMLGTPNQGTSCADLGAVVLGPLGSGAFLFPATLQLTKTYLAIFNQQVTNRRGVKFSISAGDPIPITCLEGPGDEIVPYQSALMLDPLPGTAITDAESRSILHHHMPGDPDQFSQFVKPRLTGVLPAPAAASAAGAHASARAVAAIAPPPVVAPQILAGVAVEVAASGTADVPFTVSDGTRIGVTLLAASSVTTELRDPVGTVVASVAADSDAAQAGLRTLTADAPAPGAWTLHLVNTDSAAPATIGGSAWVAGSALQLVLTPPAPNPDGSVPLTATLTNGGSAVTGATITATLTGADGPHGPATLLDDGLHGDGADGDGIYGGTTAALAPGLYGVAVQAAAPGASRFTTGAVEIASVAATPTPTASATPTTTSTDTATATPTATDTPTAVPTATDTPTAMPTATDTPAATSTATAAATDTATATPTGTPAVTLTPTPSNTPTATSTPGGGAATFTVTNTNDSGVGSLRQAILAANAAAGSDTIVFDAAVTGTILLRSGQLSITNDVSIVGPGTGVLTVSGNNASRVFVVNAGVTVAISGLTIVGGDGGGGDGGGVFNAGTLTVSASILSGNVAQLGGGIGNGSGGTLTVSDSILTGNSGAATSGPGGAISNFGVLTVIDSTISGNSSLGGNGGGAIFSFGTATVSGSTISGNSAAGSGGGIYNQGALSVVNSTFAGNAAGGNGGAILNFTGTVTLLNVTIAGNAAGSQFGDGGGIYNALASLSLANSIVAGNTDAGGQAPDCAVAVTSQGHNLIGDTTGCTVDGDATGNITGRDPLLGPLADNGGLTRTHALLAGSPAIDAGDNATCPATDQRGVRRPIDGDGDGVAACDIGAFEAAAVAGAPTATITATATPSAVPTATQTPTAISTATATPTATNTPMPGGGLLFVPNAGEVDPQNSFDASITVYDAGASGNTPPLRTITGPSTGFFRQDQGPPLEIVLDAANHEIFVSNLWAPVTVYGETASGDAAPLRTFAPPFPVGSIGSYGIDVDSLHEEVFVARANAIRVYGRSASGSDAPLRTLSGPATTIGEALDVFVDTVNDELYVVDQDFPYAISVFSRTASGDTPPLRRISGAATALQSPLALFVDTVNNEIVVANSASHAPETLQGVVVYSRTADGDVVPLRTLTGVDTGLHYPTGVFVDTVNDELYVAGASGVGGSGRVLVFCRTASGNTAPDRVLEGAATGLHSPARLWVSPVPHQSQACERSAATPTATHTPASTPTASATSTATDTPVPTTTAEPTATATSTAVHTATATATFTATRTSTPPATRTAIPPSSTATASSTSTVTATATPTPAGSAAPIVSIATATPSPTPVTSATPSAVTPQATATLVSAALAATAQRSGTATVAGLPSTGTAPPTESGRPRSRLAAAAVLALIALAASHAATRARRRRKG